MSQLNVLILHSDTSACAQFVYTSSKLVTIDGYVLYVMLRLYVMILHSDTSSACTQFLYAEDSILFLISPFLFDRYSKH